MHFHTLHIVNPLDKLYKLTMVVFFHFFLSRAKGHLIIAMLHGWGDGILIKAPKDWLDLAICLCFQSLFGNLPSILYILATPGCPFSPQQLVLKVLRLPTSGERKHWFDNKAFYFKCFRHTFRCPLSALRMFHIFEIHFILIAQWAWETKLVFFFFFLKRFLFLYLPRNTSWHLSLMKVNTVPAVICASLSVPLVFYGVPPVHPSTP